MAKRKVIKIDGNKCDGCGLCMPNCPEGAIQIIDGKAELVGDLFCDGLGACLGHCPKGAITIEEREASPYDERKVMENIVKKGANVIKAHLLHLKDHGEEGFLRTALDILKEKKIENPMEKAAAVRSHQHPHAGGCPGSRMLEFETAPEIKSVSSASIPRLSQWPVQLALVNPGAPYFKGAEIVVAADCVPFAFPDFHERFLKGKKLVIFCPKLDEGTEEYVEKLAALFKHNDTKKVTVVHMEVPCCFGTVSLVKNARERSGKNINIEDVTVSLKGEII